MSSLGMNRKRLNVATLSCPNILKTEALLEHSMTIIKDEIVLIFMVFLV